MCLFCIFCFYQTYSLKGNFLVILSLLSLHFGLYLGVYELDCVGWSLEAAQNPLSGVQLSCAESGIPKTGRISWGSALFSAISGGFSLAAAQLLLHFKPLPLCRAGRMRCQALSQGSSQRAPARRCCLCAHGDAAMEAAATMASVLTPLFEQSTLFHLQIIQPSICLNE